MNRSVRRLSCVGELLKAFPRLLGRSQRSRPTCSCVRCHRSFRLPGQVGLHADFGTRCFCSVSCRIPKRSGLCANGRPWRDTSDFEYSGGHKCAHEANETLEALEANEANEALEANERREHRLSPASALRAGICPGWVEAGWQWHGQTGAPPWICRSVSTSPSPVTTSCSYCTGG